MHLFLPFIEVVFDVTLLVLLVALTVFLAAAVVAAFPLGLAVLLILLILPVLELFLSRPAAVVDEDVLMVVVLGGELEVSTLARFTTGPFWGNFNKHQF